MERECGGEDSGGRQAGRQAGTGRKGEGERKAGRDEGAEDENNDEEEEDATGARRRRKRRRREGRGTLEITEHERRKKIKTAARSGTNLPKSLSHLFPPFSLTLFSLSLSLSRHCSSTRGS